MAMTLRLDDDLSARLREESRRTGTSQQEVIKQALRSHLRVVPTPLQRMIEAGEAYVYPHTGEQRGPLVTAPLSIMEMLDREDRL